MAKRYYVSNPNSPKGFDEVTEEEFNALRGSDEARPYASKLYKEQITIDEVPAELQEEVLAVVQARTERYGTYSTQEVPADELKNKIEGVI